MKARRLGPHEDSPYMLVFAPADPVVETLTAFARDNGVLSGRFSGIGGFEQVTLGYFDLEQKEYRKIPLHEQLEVMSLLGNITLYQNQPKVHGHVVVGKSDGTAHGGHLIEASVRPTLEVVLVPSSVTLERSWDDALGLALMRF